MGTYMTKEKSPFHMEAAGSLTPELEGSPTSSRHPGRAAVAQKKPAGDKRKQVQP